MYILIVSLILFVAALLILVILAQNSKGGGLSSQFGGSGASNMIGVKKTGDLLERLTWGLAITMLVLTLSTNLKLGQSAPEDEFSDRIEEQGPAIDFGNESGLEQLNPADNGSVQEIPVDSAN
ncbi:MAG: preprotein translocase subunit SecG [Cyclobacteriaceae bacterium]|nr:preprotein translocase subunit SecG [Cyclobacteriaceae bacterium]